MDPTLPPAVLAALGDDQTHADPTPPQQGGVVASAPEQPPPAAPAKGWLLDEPDETKVYTAVAAIVKQQAALAASRDQVGTHWGRVRRGVPWAKLTKLEDQNLYRASLPAGVDDSAQPIPNKADDLCGKIVATHLVDLPQPECVPEDDSDEKKGAADLASEFLTQDGGESGTNDAELYRDALDRTMTRGSAFAWYWLDPSGGGWRPKQIEAHPQAQDASQPMLGPDGQPTADPVLRYVDDAGQFAPDAASAARLWLPKVRARVLNPAHVRTVPESAKVADAERVLVLAYDTLGAAKTRFPELATMDPDTLRAVVEWRPTAGAKAKDLVAPALRARLSKQDKENATDTDRGPDDSALIFWYHLYVRPCPGYGGDGLEASGYPDGAEVAVSGALDGMVLHREPMRRDVGGGLIADTPPRPVLLDPPIAQFKCLHDSEDGDPFGRPIIEKFGSVNAAYARIFGAVLENMDALLHPIPFVAAGSTVQDHHFTDRSGLPVYVLGKEDMPEYEQVNELPAYTNDILNTLDQDASQAASLGETAQGLETQTAISGKAKEIAVAQSAKGLEQIRANFMDGVRRGWRIKLQLAQAGLTVPQQVALVGENAAHKRRWWTGADLCGVQEVRIKSGTGTMMGPQEKVNYAMSAAQIPGSPLDPDEIRDIVRTGLGTDLGLSKNPHEQRIDREVAAWMEGPPQGWTPAVAPAPMVDPVTQQPSVDPATQQPAMTPGQPASWTPFAPRPNDEEPAVAAVRHRRITRFISTGDYLKQPPEWRAVLDAEYARMAYAAGITTVRQQAANAQAQQQQQALQAQQQSAQESTRQDQQADAEHGRAMEKEQQKQQSNQFARIAA